MISSTKYSLKAGNICSLEVCIPLNLTNPAAPGWNKTFGQQQHRGGLGAAWLLAPEGRLAQTWNRAYHGAKTPWSLAGEILFFLPQKWALFIYSQFISVLPAPKRKGDRIIWSSPEDFHTLKSKKDPQEGFVSKFEECKSTFLTSLALSPLLLQACPLPSVPFWGFFKQISWDH